MIGCDLIHLEMRYHEQKMAACESQASKGSESGVGGCHVNLFYSRLSAYCINCICSSKIGTHLLLKCLILMHHEVKYSSDKAL